MEKFGISSEDMKLLSDEVSIVFNSAATIRFVEPLDVAVRNNIYSVAQLVQVCGQLENLRALVHLSTAYSNCHKRDTIYEIFYEPPMSGDQIIQAVATLRDVQNSVHVYPSRRRASQSSMSSASASDSGFSRAGVAGSNAELNESRSACDPQVFYEPSASASEEEQAGKSETPAAAAANLLDQFTEIALRRSNRPNTYTFTKAISENYLADLVGRQPERYLGPSGIPVAIVRPSIVGGSWREPEVGFVDNYNGGTGAILSLYTGALQAMPGCGERVADMVPVDMVVNMIIATGYFLLSPSSSSSSASLSYSAGETGKAEGRQAAKLPPSPMLPIKSDRGVYIFNFVSGYRNPLRWHQVTEKIQELAYKYPSKFSARLCGSYFVSAVGPNLFTAYDYLNHYVPAKAFDFVKRHLLGVELNKRTSSVAAYGRIKQMTDTLTPFTSNQWLLCDSNVRALNERLEPADKQLFPFDIGEINWAHYIRNYILGARIYTLRDEPRNVPQAMKSLQKRQLTYRGSLMILVLLFYYSFLSSSQLETALLGFFESLLLVPFS